MYVHFLLCVGYYALGALMGHFTSRADFIAEYALDPSNVYLIARGLSAALGTATVWVVYRIGSRTLDRRVGLVAALFLALTHLHVRDSHFGVTDVAQTFLIMCSVLFISRIATEPTRANYALAGIFAGLAMSTKYSGVFLAVPLLLSHLVAAPPRTAGWGRSLTDRRLVAFAVAMPLAFLAGTPFALLDVETFLAGVRFESRNLVVGPGLDLGRGWWYHLRFTLWHGLGGSLFVASLLGMIALVRRSPRLALVLCTFPLIYYAVAGRGLNVFLRYMIPVVPFLCLTAAVLTVALARTVAGRRSARLANLATLTLAILVIAPSAWNVLRSDALLRQLDSRVVAAAWARAHMGPRSAVHQAVGRRWERVPLPQTLESLQQYSEPAAADAGRMVGAMHHIRVERLKAAGLPVFEEWSYDPARDAFLRGPDVRADGPQYIIRFSSPLPGSPPAPGIDRLLASSYRLVHSVRGAGVDRADNFYDRQDAFYLPFAGFHDVERPGPNIEIYGRAR
jgi:hypothetical protein